MHKTLLLAVFASSLMAGAASADPYKWCAHYGGKGGGGGDNCGFVSLAQCQATVFGMGGYCAVNQFYTGDERAVRRVRRHHSG